MITTLLNTLTLQNSQVPKQRKMVFIISVLAFFGLTFYRSEIHEAIQTIPYIPKLFQLLLMTLFVYIVVSGIRIFIVSVYRRKHHINREERDNFTIGASALVGTITTFSLFFSFFVVYEISIYTFLTSIALFSVSLATIFKDTVQDFIEGLFMLFSSDYGVGDYVQIGNHPRGMIKNISLSKTELRLEDGGALFISNHVVRGSAVINLSKTKKNVLTVSLSIHDKASKKTDTTRNELFTYIERELADYIHVSKTSVYLAESTKDSTTFACEVVLKEFNFKAEKQIRHTIQEFTLLKKK